jgi:hypothetical protein
MHLLKKLMHINPNTFSQKNKTNKRILFGQLELLSTSMENSQNGWKKWLDI